MHKEIEIDDANGDGLIVRVPMRWAICGACEGHGKSSAYLGAYTADEMDKAGIETGDVAGMCFSGVEWSDLGVLGRLEAIGNWLAHEDAFSKHGEASNG